MGSGALDIVWPTTNVKGVFDINTPRKRCFLRGISDKSSIIRYVAQDT
jgi:hypothetical protein